MFPQATILRRALAYSSTSTAFQSVVPTTTAPASVDSDSPSGNRAVMESGGSSLFIVPIGTDAADETYSIRLIAWKKLTGAEGTTPLWIPIHLGDINVTLGSATGISGGLVGNSELFADTLALASGAWSAITLIQPAGNLPAAFIVPSKGFAHIEAVFDSTGAASMNLLWGPVPEL